MNGGLDLGSCCGFRQSVAQKRHGHTRRLEVRLEHEHLGPSTAGWNLCRKIGSHRPGATAFACLEVGARRRQSAPVPIVDGIRRCQTQRVSGELGGGDRYSSMASCARGQFQGAGELFTRLVGGQREVPAAMHRVIHDLCKSPVGGATVFAVGGLVERGSEQRVGEADDTICGFDDVRRTGLIERLGRDLHSPQEPYREAAVRGDQQESPPRRCPERANPCVDEALQAWRNGQWQRRVTCRIHGSGAGKLEGIERISAGCLMELQQGRSRERNPQPLVEEHVDSANAHGTGS